jgi:predicted DNA binding CopG/RHH family protein
MKKSKKNNMTEKDPLARDLSDLITNGKWRPINDFFKYQPKNKTITLRISEDLLAILKKMAEKQKTDYQKLIREAVIEFVTKKSAA